MNKKVNTLLFILGATLFNIFTAIASVIILFLVYAHFVHEHLPEANRSWVFSFIFLVSIIISFVVYRVILKYLLTKVDIEKYFDPIFVSKNRRHLVKKD